MFPEMGCPVSSTADNTLGSVSINGGITCSVSIGSIGMSVPPVPISTIPVSTGAIASTDSSIGASV